MAGSALAWRTEQPTRTPCGQTLALSRGRHGRVLRPFTRLTCTAPNDGAVNVAKTFGWDSTESGIPLPPRSPAATRWKASRRYQLAQERHRAARRPAGNEQHVVGLPLGRVDPSHLPRGPVHLLDSSPDANRTAAVTDVLDLLAPAAHARPRP